MVRCVRLLCSLFVVAALGAVDCDAGGECAGAVTDTTNEMLGRGVVVLGATGRLGRWVVRALVKDGFKSVTCLVRNEERARKILPQSDAVRLIKGNADSLDDIKAAIAATSDVAIVHQSVGEYQGEVTITKNILTALADKPDVMVSKISAFNVGADNPDGKAKQECEDAVAASPHPFIMWRSGFFVEDFDLALSFADKTATVPPKTLPRSFFAASELGEWTSKAFQEPEKHRNKAYPLQTRKKYTFEEFFTAFGVSFFGPEGIKVVVPDASAFPEGMQDFIKLMQVNGEDFRAEPTYAAFGEPKRTLDEAVALIKQHNDHVKV
eukprot:Hpha_TRINITY_DN5684_c0_g1::TRINITY_DN5684_c0_g1_i2::g.50725::m.50725